jgi:hypothetical protein
MQRSSILLGALLVGGLSAGTGCAGSAAVRGDERLPVRSVVLYRSGVGYFERSGKFAGDALEFRVKQSEVGDFLASLTALERSSGGVRSVSFEVPDEPVPAPPPPIASAPDEAFALRTPAPPQPPPSRTSDPHVEVTIALTGNGAHDLTVAYVVGSPVWRPSYRVVFDGSGKALLQAWAVVQNTSGEDWRDVRLSLTTGAPISFRSDLGTPITPRRPLVTDSGEVVDYVPTGETVLSQQPQAPQAPPPPAQAEAPAMDEMREAEESLADQDASQLRLQKKGSRGVAGGAAAAPMASRPLAAAALAATVQSRASATVVSESVTRYDLSEPVTVPNGSSTMVAIVSARVTGEQAHLFAPDYGVPLSSQHPFSVARLRNEAGSVLEKGPISVLSNGSFMGQGLLDTLPRDAQAFVPFSLDKSIVVEPAEQWSEESGSLVRVAHGLVTVRRFSQRKMHYRFRNGGAAATKVYVRHARWAQAELVSPPAGTELAPDKVLVPVSVPPHGAAELELVERTPVEVELSIMDPRVAEAAGLWLTGPAANDPQNAPLKRALELGRELAKLDAELANSEREQAEVNAAASEARKNLKAIEKLPSAKDLRTRLFERLKQHDARGAELTQQLIENRTKRAELEVRVNEALDQVTLEIKPPPA